MTPDLELTPELLASQGRSLRALARRLLGDAHEAEDVAQDTWVAYLRHSRSIRGRLANWMGRVARNRALQRQRGAARQRGRERESARHERLEADQEALLAREEAVRAVTEALLELDEPYRVVLLLRFYEDRTPIEIARQLGLPPTTVKSRLERGLERLRARLKARNGGDERWLSGLAALAGLPSRSALAGPLTLGTGALVMGSKLTLALASAAVACGAFFLWPKEPPREPSTLVVHSSSAPVRGAAVQPLEAALDAPPTAPAPEREPVLAPAEEPALPEPPLPVESAFPFRIEIHARNALDLPLPDAEVFLGFRGQPLNRAGTTDSAGTLVVEFLGRRANLEGILDVRSGDASLGPRRIDLSSGQPFVADVGLRSEGAPTGLRLELTAASSASGRFEFRTSFSFQGHPDLVPAASGRSLFVAQQPRLACLRPATDPEVRESEVLLRDLLAADQTLSTPRVFQRARRVEQVALMGRIQDYLEHTAAGTSPESVALQGTARDASGVPMPHVAISWRTAEGPWRRSAESDGEGHFELTDLPTGEPLRLRAGGGDHGVDALEITLAEGQHAAWDPLLRRGAEVSGRLVDADGQALGGRAIELEGRGFAHLWNDTTVTLDDGRFALPNVPPGRHDLFVMPGASPSGLPVAMRTGVAAGDDLGTLVIDTGEEHSASFTLALRGRTGDPVPSGSVRLWQADSRRGLFLESSDEEGRCGRAGLAPGRYDVEALCDLGGRDLGSVWLEPDRTLDLGEETFGTPGTLTVRLDPALGQRMLDLWSEWDGLAAHVTAFGGPRTTLLLQPGDYLVTTRSGEPGLRARVSIVEGRASAFVLQAGTEGLALRPDAPPPHAGRANGCASCHGL